MNELVVANNPIKWPYEAGLEGRMIDACITEEGIKIEIVFGGQTRQFEYDDVLEFMEDWRLARGVEQFVPWEEHSIDEIMTNHTNVVSGHREKTQASMLKRSPEVVPFKKRES